MPFSDDEARWVAVAGRDRAADGWFLYAVKTTGVYCRPSCAARRPRRENVGFHRTPGDAEAAGFRPCKRCRPDRPSIADRNRAIVVEACRRIDAAADLPPDLAGLAEGAGLSRFHFHRVFKAVTGSTPKAYAVARRARHELSRSATVTQAIYDSGFPSGGRFYAQAIEMLGMTPSTFRAGGAGETIRFAVGDSTLGAILVAATARGVCAILLGDDPEPLVRELQDRFPGTDLVGGDEAFEQLVARVVGFVEAPGIGLDLPLDIRGTAFQQRVWQELVKIPLGETASYTEVANRIGAPKAVRAVAGACASNAIAIAIPCHRVVRTDGGLSGYRWGVERKRSLLNREARSRG